jgi:hypothetical protein
MAKTTGYVVRASGNNFLDESMHFVENNELKNTKMTENTWVHSEEDLLEGGDWTSQAEIVYPARFNSQTNLTEITGKPVTYGEFIMKLC